jgi:hypothetical protein
VVPDVPSPPDVPAVPDVPPVDVGAPGCERDGQCGAGQICEATRCVAQRCTPNARQCVSGARTRVCDSRGAVAVESDCAGTQRCEAGNCVARACTPGSVTCTSPTLRGVCDGAGTGYVNETCASAPNATGACAGGVCALTCETGFAECDGVAVNGCEANTNTSLAHCGGCGRSCATSCVGGVCSGGGPRPWGVVTGGATEDRINEVAVDLSGNVAVVGTFVGQVTLAGTRLNSAGGIDGFVASFGADGSLRWVQRIGSTGNDTAFGVAVDDAGNVYATGGVADVTAIAGATVTPSDSALETWVASWTSGGAARWGRGMGGTLADQGLGIAVDTVGNAWVGGNFSGTFAAGAFNLTTFGLSDVFVARLDNATGVPRGLGRFGGTAGDFFGAVSADPSDGLVLGLHTASTGLSFGAGVITNAGSNDGVVLRLSPTFTVRQQLVVASTSGENIVGVGLDAAGNVYYAGQTQGTTLRVGTTNFTLAANDSFIGSFSAVGAARWFTPITSAAPTSSAEIARGFSVRPDGTSYTVGTTTATTFAVGTRSATGSGAQAGFVLVADSSGGALALRVSGTGPIVPLGVATTAGRIAIGGELGTSGTFEGVSLSLQGNAPDAFVLSDAR